MSIEERKERENNQLLLKQLIDPSLIHPFSLPFPFKGTLRGYQKDGIKWMKFLNDFGLNGILADDMGLGKTLQTLLIIAWNTSFPNGEKEKEKGKDLRPNLIVCPSTVVWHWQNEIFKFLEKDMLQFCCALFCLFLPPKFLVFSLR